MSRDASSILGRPDSNEPRPRKVVIVLTPWPNPEYFDEHPEELDDEVAYQYDIFLNGEEHASVGGTGGSGLTGALSSAHDHLVDWIYDEHPGWVRS